jgi:hypothetical protein
MAALTIIETLIAALNWIGVRLERYDKTSSSTEPAVGPRLRLSAQNLTLTNSSSFVAQKRHDARSFVVTGPQSHLFHHLSL